MFEVDSCFILIFFAVNQMMIVFWAVMISFFMSHWEKYNTGVLYLPWAYDFSQVVGIWFAK